MKIVIDIAADETALAALKERSDCEVECIQPPEERARELDPERIRGADVLFAPSRPPITK